MKEEVSVWDDKEQGEIINDIFLTIVNIIWDIKTTKKTSTLCLLYIYDDWFLFIFLKISNNCFIYQLNSSVCLTHFTGYSSLSLLRCPPPRGLHTC